MSSNLNEWMKLRSGSDIRGKADQLILRSEGLDDRPAGLAAPSAASDDLSYERKCPLTRAVIAAVQALIGRDNADERYIFKVEPLGDHLCADHYGYLFVFKPAEQRIMAAGGLDRIRIHTQNTCIGIQLMKLILNKLRARADEREHSSAIGTAAVRFTRIAAGLAAKRCLSYARSPKRLWALPLPTSLICRRRSLR